MESLFRLAYIHRIISLKYIQADFIKHKAVIFSYFNVMLVKVKVVSWSLSNRLSNHLSGDSTKIIK